MGYTKLEEQKKFKKLGYPAPYDINLSLNIDEAEFLREILRKKLMFSTNELKDRDSILIDLHKEIGEYKEALTKRYERPWCRADDF